MLIKKVLPHVELLIAELGDVDPELDDQVAAVALLVHQSALLHHVPRLLRGQSLPPQRHLLPVQVLEAACEPEEGLLQRDLHEVDQVVALPRPLRRGDLDDGHLEVRGGAVQGLLPVVAQGQLVAVGQALGNGDLDLVGLAHQLRPSAVVAHPRHGLPGTSADRTHAFGLELLPVEVLLVAEGEALGAALSAGPQILGTLGAGSVADGAGGLPGEVGGNNRSVIDIGDGDGDGEFESGSLAFIPA